MYFDALGKNHVTPSWTLHSSGRKIVVSGVDNSCHYPIPSNKDGPSDLKTGITINCYFLLHTFTVWTTSHWDSAFDTASLVLEVNDNVNEPLDFSLQKMLPCELDTFSLKP